MKYTNSAILFLIVALVSHGLKRRSASSEGFVLETEILNMAGVNGAEAAEHFETWNKDSWVMKPEDVPAAIMKEYVALLDAYVPLIIMKQMNDDTIGVPETDRPLHFKAVHMGNFLKDYIKEIGSKLSEIEVIMKSFMENKKEDEFKSKVSEFLASWKESTVKMFARPFSQEDKLKFENSIFDFYPIPENLPVCSYAFPLTYCSYSDMNGKPVPAFGRYANALQAATALNDFMEGLIMDLAAAEPFKFTPRASPLGNAIEVVGRLYVVSKVCLEYGVRSKNELSRFYELLNFTIYALGLMDPSLAATTAGPAAGSKTSKFCALVGNYATGSDGKEYEMTKAENLAKRTEYAIKMENIFLKRD